MMAIIIVVLIGVITTTATISAHRKKVVFAKNLGTRIMSTRAKGVGLRCRGLHSTARPSRRTLTTTEVITIIMAPNSRSQETTIIISSIVRDTIISDMLLQEADLSTKIAKDKDLTKLMSLRIDLPQSNARSRLAKEVGL